MTNVNHLNMLSSLTALLSKQNKKTQFNVLFKKKEERSNCVEMDIDNFSRSIKQRREIFDKKIQSHL